MLEHAVVAPAAAVAGAVQRARPAPCESGSSTKRSAVSSGAVEIAQGHAVAADADLARHADRAQLAVLVEDPDLGVRDRPADRMPAPARAARTRAQVDHTVVSVGPYMFQSSPQRSSSCVGQVRRQRLRRRTAALKPRPALPAGHRAAPPAAGVACMTWPGCSRPARAARRHRVAASRLGDHDLRADAQRQQQLQHGDVERQRGHRDQAVVGGDARLALHAGEEVRDAHGAAPARPWAGRSSRRCRSRRRSIPARAASVVAPDAVARQAASSSASSASSVSTGGRADRTCRRARAASAARPSRRRRP